VATGGHEILAKALVKSPAVGKTVGAGIVAAGGIVASGGLTRSSQVAKSVKEVMNNVTATGTPSTCAISRSLSRVGGWSAWSRMSIELRCSSLSASR